MPLQPVSIVMKLVSPQSCRTRIAEAAEDGMGWASTPKLTTNLGLQEARKVPQCTGSVASDDGRHSATWIVKSWQWLCRPWREDLFWCLDVQSRQYFHNVHHCSSLFKELSNETNHRDRLLPRNPEPTLGLYLGLSSKVHVTVKTLDTQCSA
jgi:hypothetical protein